MEPKQFGQRVREARERLALSQEELAALVSKDQRSISEYEQGKRRLSVTDLPAFAAALEVPVTYFFDEQSTVSDQDQALLYYFHKLPSSAAKQVAIGIVQLLSRAFEQ